MPQHRDDDYYAFRRNDGYVDACKGHRPTPYNTTTFEILAGGEWEKIRGVVLVERASLRVDEVGRYRLELTEKPRRYPWSRDEDAQTKTRHWDVDGTELRALLWDFASGDHEDLPKGSYFDEAGHKPGGTDFLLRGCTYHNDLELTATLVA
ncbi:hypothetical protein [Streptomyces ipomoeae]|uniref:hypothetical protein n=1 Tax=Streptomyces ipomoeae TaxID=103232 RepID=UPI001147A5D8|nr:hypothetical protein [Streptomyces ipomoeae]TQE33092.1 hypothetical protein Sipo7851_21560 [Streptomyces ipomoeae]